MADSTETRTKIVRIVYDASKAKEGAQDARRSLEEIERAALKSASSLEKMDGTLDDLGQGFSTVTRLAGTFGVALSLGALVSWSRGLNQAIGGLNSMAEELTTNTRYLQAVQFAAAGATVKLSDLEVGMAAAARKAGEASEGNKAAIETFQRLGVKVLDAKGNLRPLNETLTESARALLAVEEPQRRVALATDLLDKAGRRMLPMLKELAKGQEELGVNAERAGAMIGQETIDRLDKLGSKSEEASLKVRALYGELGAPIVLQGLEGASTLLGQIISQLERGRASGQGFWAEVLKDSRAQGRMGGLRLSTPEEEEADRRARLKGELEQYERDPGRRAMIQEDLDRLNRRTALDRQASFESEEAWARRFKPPLVDGTSGGARTPTVKATGAGDDEAKRWDKLVAQLEAAAAAQDNMTAASRRGEIAFSEQQIAATAAEKAIGVYGKALDANDPKLRRLVELITRDVQGKAAEAFNVATTALQNQNVVLEAELALVGQLPEIRARELALIKAKQEAEKAGSAVTAEDVERRRQAIEQNERLKIQAEELRKAQELWTEPLKQALRDIQSTAADAFQQMLESGNFSFEQLGQTFKKIITRMIAEFLALATIRPVMSVIVNAISPGIAQQMGMGGSSMSSGSMGSGNMGGGMPMLGGGGGGLLENVLGGLFNGSSSTSGTGFGSLFGSQGLFGGAVPETAGVMGPMMPGALNPGYGLQMGSFGLGNLSGALGVGMGAMSLAGAKNTGQTIGGIGQMVGGGLMMIPTPWTMAAGAVISLASSILPGLFESKPEPPTMRATGGLNFTGGRFVSTGSEYGGASSVLGTLGGVGQSMQALLDAAGVRSLSSPNSLTYQTFSKGDFSNATTFVNGRQWGQGSGGDAGLDTAAAHIAHKIMLEVDSGISDVMREGLSNFGAANLDRAFSTNDLGDAVGKLTALDEAMKTFGKTTTDAEAAIKAIDESFNPLFNTAAEFQLSMAEVAKIEAERGRQRLKATEEFSYGITQGLLGFDNPMQAAINDLDRQRKKDLESNAAYVRLVAGYQDQAANIDRLYYLERNKLIEQSNAEALAAQERAAEAAKAKFLDLQAVVDRLTYGDLSNLTGSGRYAGAYGALHATHAQAMTGDESAFSRFGGEVLSLAELGQQQFASGPGYEALRQELIGLTLQLQARTAGGVVPGTAANDGPVNIVVQQQAVQIQQLTNLVADLGRQQQELMRRLGETNDLQLRLANKL